MAHATHSQKTSPVSRAFKLFPERVADAEKILDRYNRKACKLGLAELTWEVGPEHTIRHDGHPYGAVDLTVTGELPVLDGWTTLGVISHERGGVNLLTSVAGVEEGALLPFADAGPNCDHCKSRRYRTKTIVVRKKGEVKQLGTTCVDSFIEGGNVSGALWAITAFGILLQEIGAKDLEREDSGIHFGAPAVDLGEFLEAVACAIRCNGWTSKGAASAENDSVPTAFQAGKVNKADITDPDREVAAAALLRAQGIEATDEFTHNLKAAASVGHVISNGICAYIVQGYLIELAKANESGSEHVGSIKERRVFEVTFVGISSYNGEFGCTYYVRFKDAAGNNITWRGGNAYDVLDENPAVGSAYVIKATVVKHDDYQGVKSTVVNRGIKFVPKPPKAKRARKAKAAN